MIAYIDKVIVSEFTLYTALVFSKLYKGVYTSRLDLVKQLDGYVAKRTIYQALDDLEKFGYIDSKYDSKTKNGNKLAVKYKIKL